VIHIYVDHLEVERPHYNDHNTMKKVANSEESLSEVEKLAGEFG